MTNVTKRKATIAGLRACGHVENVGRSTKYRAFEERTEQGTPLRTFLVGPSGAFRVIKIGDNSISKSVSRTGTKQHSAFAYTGRIYRICKDSLTPSQYQDIYLGVLQGNIPVTKDGYYDDNK